MSGKQEWIEKGHNVAAKEEPMKDAGATNHPKTGKEATQAPLGLPFGLHVAPWPGPGNSDGGGFDWFGGDGASVHRKQARR